MGSAVSSATNAIQDAFTDTRNNVQDAWRTLPSGVREEVNRAAAVMMPVAYAGNAVGVETYENGGDVMAAAGKVAGDLGIVAPPVTVPGDNAANAVVADPQQKRKRQLAGRAGTLLTGGGTGQGTNLGGAGGRSTLLGL
jgi:hypothetical protein